jgi:hypothetical protein
MAFKLDAVAREAKAEPFEFTFDGETYTMPPDFDVRYAGMMTDGDVLGGLAGVLGPEQWERLNSADAILSITKVNELLEEWCEHIGVELGESSAPSRSVRRTAARSKATSNGSTGSRSRTNSRTRRA